MIEGVHRIELPLPFTLGLVNVYLIRLSDGYLLIDCGLDTADCLAALTRALEDLGIAWRAIRRILVTHTGGRLAGRAGGEHRADVRGVSQELPHARAGGDPGGR